MEPKLGTGPSPLGIPTGPMAQDAVPPALADVVGPLREADEYTRLQAIRQRGLYNVLTGLPGFLFVSPGLLPLLIVAVRGEALGPATSFALLVLTWGSFVLSCFPRLFLPVVRRLRPDWQSPLLEASLLKRALEKQFWFQAPFWMAAQVVVPLGFVLFVSRAFADPFAAREVLGDARLMIALLTSVLLLAGAGTLAWQARRNGDQAMAAGFLAWIAVGVLSLWLGTGDDWLLHGMVVLAMALVTPPIVVGLARLLVPRRWLVR